MFFWLAAVGIAALAHLAPFPFLLDVTDRTLWRMPKGDPPTVYLTFDDGPNPEATPALLDVLQRHGVRATFFIIDKYLTAETIPILRRTVDDGHAVGIHSDTRKMMFYNPTYFASIVQEFAGRIELAVGQRPCYAFRPHGGGRSVNMLMGAGRAGYTVVGWGWMLWDANLFRRRNADTIVPRLADRAFPGDIIVIHDGHHEDPRADRQYAVETVDRLIPELKAKGFEFGTICPDSR